VNRPGRRKSATAYPPGTVVADRYQLEDKLGEGGMAEVFRARDTETGCLVAVKILHASIAANPEAVERTKREGKLLSELDNPAIVQVETYGQLDDGCVYLVMELLEGETLGDRMRGDTLEPTELAPIVAGTCAGLAAAHAKGIVHRDLKPDNIFLCPTDHGLQVKLLDFGISKVTGGEKLTQTGEVLGTPRYMSPEQLGAEHDIDVRADVYALGVILYEALAGKPPFLASTPTELIIAILNGKVAPLSTARPDVSANVEGVVMRALSKVRAARYDTPMQLADAYIEAVGGVATVRRQQRRGLRTRAFGGKAEGEAVQAAVAAAQMAVPGTNPPPPPSEKSVAGKLALGTFSGLPQMAAAAAPEPRALPETGPGLRDEPSSRRKRPMPMTRETPAGIPDTPVPLPARSAVPATAMMEASQAPSMMGQRIAAPSVPIGTSAPVPRKRRPWGRVLLVVGALLAGAGSAAAVVFLMTHFNRPAEAEEATAGSDDAPETEPVVEPRTPPETEAEPPPGETPTSPPGAEAGAPEAAPEPSTTSATEPAPRRRRRSTRRRTASPAEVPEDPASQPGFPSENSDSQSPRELLRSARRAMQGGDAARCVSLLDRALANGASPIVLRRRGECFDRLGQRNNAIRDYQRFCRLVPDHPAIGEVRPLLESWGRSCP